MTSKPVGFCINIVTALDCKIANNISSLLQKKLNQQNEYNLNTNFYKDFKKIDEISQENNLYIFIVSSYLNGKRCRSIRRFQRKLDNANNIKLNKLYFIIISLNDAEQESNKMYNTLTNKRSAIPIYSQFVMNNDNDNDHDQIINITLSSIHQYIPTMSISTTTTTTTATTIEDKEEGHDQRHDEHAYDFSIGYGTQTGNAKQICNEIVSIALSQNDQYAINGPISLNKLNINNIKFLIIVVSTTGDGEVPQNADIFYRKLKMKCLSLENKNKLFEHMNYAILGLGDSNYSQFNAAAKNIDQCLSYLGGHKFYHTGYADDGIGLEDVVEPWKVGVINEIQRKLQIKIKIKIKTPPSSPPLSTPPSSSSSFYKPSSFINFSPKFRILKCFNSKITSSLSRYELFTNLRSKSYKAYDSNNQFLIELISSKYETSFEMEHYTETIVITLTFRLPNGYSYEIGDVLCIYPPNPDWMVSKLLKRLKFNGTDIIKINTINEISSTNPLPHIPFKKEITISDIFRFCIDIRSIPKSKLFIKSLSTFCQNENDKINLLNNINNIHNRYQTLFDLFDEYSSCYPTLQCLLHFLSELKPRKYSICSSPNYKPDEIDICLRILKSDNNVQQHYLDGLCSCFLYSLCINQCKLLNNNSDKVKMIKYDYGFIDNSHNSKIKIAAYLKLSPHFKPPSNPLSSLILIGPGTGVGIFRAFLQHRLQQNKIIISNNNSTICDGPWRGIDMQFSDEPNHNLNTNDDFSMISTSNSNSKCVLFFGCRHPKKDYLYKTDWKQFLENGVLNDLFVAFSRYHENKVYVQHLLKENSELITNMILSDNAYIFVCGDASKMAKDVENTFIELVALHSKMSLIESTKYIQNMKSTNRYNTDVWNSSFSFV